MYDNFYDIKLSSDKSSDIENFKGILITNEENIKNKWYHNKCYFFSALLMSSIIIATGSYLCFIFC